MMTAVLSTPIWLGFFALAIPLLIVAGSAYHASEIYEADSDPEGDVVVQEGVLEDGTVTQTVSMPASGTEPHPS